MAIVSVGIDLAKNVFAVHGVDESGKPALVRPSVPRAKLLELIASLPPCLIGMEACSGAHHWAREFQKFGHTVRLMAPKFVIPYRLSGKRGKNDSADAAAICEAVTRPNMRFVPVKSAEQQGQLLVHRARQGFVEQRTATLNRIRGLLSELGIVLPLKAAVVRRDAIARLEDFHRALEHHRQRARLQVWSPAVRLARSGARAVQLWRQAAPGSHHQGRRSVPAQLAGAGCAGGAGRSEEQERPDQSVGQCAGTAPGLLESRGRHRRQERPHVLGGAQSG